VFAKLIILLRRCCDEGKRMTTTKTKSAQALTAKAIEAMKPDPLSAFRVPDLRCKGLALRVATDGHKTWDLTFRIKNSGVRRPSLGRYEDVSLEQARKRANALTSAARSGRDLIAEENDTRNEHNQSFSVEQLVSEYMRRRVTGRLRTANDVEHALKRALAPMMTRKVSDIKRRDLRQLLDAVADRGRKREAGRRRQAIGAMFKWALSQDIVDSNPADGLSSYNLSKPRDRVLSEDEIRVLWSWLDDSRNIDMAVSAILKLQLCLGARVGEISGMLAGELSTDAKGRLLWTLPAERVKNARARITPIVGLAKEIIASRDGEILFPAPSGEPFYSALIAQRLLNRSHRLPIAKFVSHDLRRTVATRMVELGLPLELVATAVGHEAGGGRVQTLVRHYVHDDFIDRKADALAKWDRRLRQILAGESGRIIPLRA
jgi:integrase